MITAVTDIQVDGAQVKASHTKIYRVKTSTFFLHHYFIAYKPTDADVPLSVIATVPVRTLRRARCLQVQSCKTSHCCLFFGWVCIRIYCDS